MLELIPDHLFIDYVIISGGLLPTNDFDYKTFFNYRLVNRKFAGLFMNKKIFRILSKYFNIINKPNEFINYYKYISNIVNLSSLHIMNYFPDRILDKLGGISQFLKLPTIHNVEWWIVSQMYTLNTLHIGSIHDPWEKLKNRMTHSIMRGVDTMNRHFLLLKYYNYTQKRFILEILYNSDTSNNEWSFSGERLNCYIGQIAPQNNIYRILSHQNFIMFDYIIDNRKMCIVNSLGFNYKSGKSYCRFPFEPRVNDYFSDSDSDEEAPFYTLRECSKNKSQIITLDY